MPLPSIHCPRYLRRLQWRHLWRWRPRSPLWSPLPHNQESKRRHMESAEAAAAATGSPPFSTYRFFSGSPCHCFWSSALLSGILLSLDILQLSAVSDFLLGTWFCLEVLVFRFYLINKHWQVNWYLYWLEPNKIADSPTTPMYQCNLITLLVPLLLCEPNILLENQLDYWSK